MPRPSIILVESDLQLQAHLKPVLESRFVVTVCSTGSEAQMAITRSLLYAIVLSCDLSDVDGYELLQEWRTSTRTSHIPVLLTQRDATREDRIKGLELGADDFITNPRDADNLLRRVKNTLMIVDDSAIKRLDSLTGLVRGIAIEDRFHDLFYQKRFDWVYIDIKITDFESFNEVYGWQRADDVLKLFGETLRETVKAVGIEDDLIGHPGRDCFCIITHAKEYEKMIETVVEKFSEMVIKHYSQEDIERGNLLFNGEEVPLMRVEWGICDARVTQPQDGREVVETAQKNRQQKDPNYIDDTNDDADDSILTAW